MNIGVIELLHGWEEEAEAHLYQAYTLYHPRGHRRAVAAWTLGIAEWQMRQNKAGQFHWQEACEIFTDIFNTFHYLLVKERNTQNVNSLNPQSQGRSVKDKVDWYQRTLDRIKTDMCKKVDEIYLWFKKSEAFKMGDSSHKFKDIFEEKLERNLYPSANSLIQEIQKHSLNYNDYNETPVILIECSLAAYQTGNLLVALELVDRAISRFPPESHSQAIARWMSGALLWEIPSRQERARRNWQMCIEEMERLAQKADRDDRQDRRQWYLEKRESMKAALADKLKEAYTGDSRGYFFNNGIS